MKKPDRIVALDAFRGITIAMMIMVNQPGSWSYKYEQMSHAKWNGCTITDLVFPFFLFIVGVAMWFSFQKYGQKLSTPIALKIVKRTIGIFLIGIFLNIFSQVISNNGFDLSSLRITGVMQRIAICYGLGAMICLLLKPKQLLVFSFGILISYWAILWGFGGSEPYLADSTIVGKIDIFLLGGNHLRQGYPVDTSGFFASIPPIVHIIWGYLLGRAINSNNNRNELVLNLFLVGIPSILVAGIWNYSFPINKTLWTSSYVLYSNGWAFIVLAFFIWIIDIKQQKKWISPLVVFGLNPLFAYVFAQMFSSVISKLIHFNIDGQSVSLKTFLYNDIFVPLAGNLNGSLFYSIFIMIFYWSILWVLNKKNIIIKI